jgi:methylated-DNA-[protein]-cysteine S-methyltransferase
MFARKTFLSKVGPLTLESMNDAIVKVSFHGIGPDVGQSPVIDQAVKELQEYFDGSRQIFSVKVRVIGTPFQQKVWTALQQVPFGVFPSYADIAEAIGRPTATRAVGMANHRNPVPIFIPCHRVIGKNGDLTGYAGGLELKQKLIKLEAGQSSLDS